LAVRHRSTFQFVFLAPVLRTVAARPSFFPLLQNVSLAPSLPFTKVFSRWRESDNFFLPGNSPSPFHFLALGQRRPENAVLFFENPTLPSQVLPHIEIGSFFVFFALGLSHHDPPFLFFFPVGTLSPSRPRSRGNPCTSWGGGRRPASLFFFSFGTALAPCSGIAPFSLRFEVSFLPDEAYVIMFFFFPPPAERRLGSSVYLRTSSHATEQSFLSMERRSASFFPSKPGAQYWSPGAELLLPFVG